VTAAAERPAPGASLRSVLAGWEHRPPLPMVQATSSITPNDIRARILRLPRPIREAIPRGQDTLDIRISTLDFYGALTIDRTHAYLGGVTELFRRIDILRDGDDGPQGRRTRVTWSYDPQANIASLELAIEDDWQPLPRARLVGGPASALDPAMLVAEGLAGLTPEREEARRAAVDEARTFVEQRLGALTPEEVRYLLQLFNVDHRNGRRKADRFAPGFVGSLANDIVASTDALNRWIPRLWGATTDAAIERVLDDFWAAKEVPGAGRSLPTMLLHVRDPEHHFPIMTGLAKGYAVLTGRSVTGRRGASYLEYAKGLVELRRSYDVPVHATDLVLMAATRSTASAPAPEPHDDPRRSPAPPAAVAPVAVAPAPAPAAPPAAPTYDLDALMADTLLAETEVEELEQLLAEKPQLILYGAPGTGKTFLAEALARYLIRNGGEQRVVQFHPSYGYEDFVEGIRPVVSPTVGAGAEPRAGQVGYRVEPGIFRQLCDQARERPKETFVLVVDEINRGNLPRIFGELLYLLERRGPDYEVELPISRQAFSVPSNLVVLGTMNTADQSIALVDVALRRRFHFFALSPNPQRLREWLGIHAPRMVDVASLLQQLNDALRDEGIDENLFIGHAHFMRKGLDELSLQRVWKRSIEPTLEEYFYGKRDKVARFRFEAFVEGEVAAVPEEAAGD
jgi:AAA domain (dynein-related subfamily)